MAEKIQDGIQHSENAEDEEEEFHDAESQFSSTKEESLSDDVAKVYLQKAVDLMFLNKYNDAQAVIKPWSEVNMFCATGKASILFCQAIMTFDYHVIQDGLAALDLAMEVCNKKRRKQGLLASVSSILVGRRMDDCSNEELQAEVFHAGCNLLSAILTFIQDENIVNFLKSSLKVKMCHSQYKNCYSWLRDVEKGQVDVDENVSAGIRLGIGTFNLMISLLPPKLIKVLEFAGFGGNRSLGILELRKASCGISLFSTLSSAMLLFHHTVTCTLLGYEESGVQDTEEILSQAVQRYPESYVFRYFKGRLAMINGQIDEAIGTFTECINSGIDESWVRVYHLCYWELLWCYSMKCEWKEAAKYAEMLAKQSRWSKTIFLYLWASLLIMWYREDTHFYTKSGTDPDLPSLDHIQELMLEVPTHMKRVAGKTLPLEKLAVYRAQSYVKGEYVAMPLAELFYGWNIFQILKKRSDLVQVHLQLIQTEQLLVKETGCYGQGFSDPKPVDNACLLSLLEGVCQRCLEKYAEAEECDLFVINRGPQVNIIEYVVPAAALELGMICIEKREYGSSKKWLNTAKSSFKSYNLEYRINFRIHACQDKLNKLSDNDS